MDEKPDHDLGTTAEIQSQMDALILNDALTQSGNLIDENHIAIKSIAEHEAETPHEE